MQAGRAAAGMSVPASVVFGNSSMRGTGEVYDVMLNRYCEVVEDLRYSVMAERRGSSSSIRMMFTIVGGEVKWGGGGGVLALS